MWWQHAAVVLAATLRFWGCLTGAPLYDDWQVGGHPAVNGKAPWTAAFTTDFWGLPMASRFSHKSYRPLSILAFRLHYLLVPLDGVASTLSYHVSNVALHLVNTYGVWALACRLFPTRVTSRPFIAALAFAVHPLLSETVCCMTYRADLLSATLFLASLLSYIACEERCSAILHSSTHSASLWVCRCQYGLSLLCGLGALLCKEQGVTVFGLLIVYDVLKVLQRGGGRYVSAAAERVALCVLMLVLLVVARLRMNFGPSPRWHRTDNILVNEEEALTRFLTFHYLIGRHWVWMVWPLHFCHDWNHESVAPVAALWDSRNLLAVGTYGVALWACVPGVVTVLRQCWGVVKGNNSRSAELKVDSGTLATDSDCSGVAAESFSVLPSPVLGLFLCIGAALPFIPASNLFFEVGFTLAERVMYLPCAFFCLGVGVLWGDVVEWLERRGRLLGLMATVLGVCVLGLCFTVTLARSYDWQDFHALIRSDIVTNPNSPKNWYTLARELHSRGDIDGAFENYARAEAMRPGYAEPLINMANIYKEDKKDVAAAHKIYEKLLYVALEANLTNIRKRDHIILHTILAVEVARESKNTTQAALYRDFAHRVYSMVKHAEMDPLPAKLLGDVFANAGNVTYAEIWYDRALHRQELAQLDLLRLTRTMAVLHRALFLEQRRQGNVRFGLYLSTRLDGLLWHALTVRVASVDPTSNAQDEALLTRFVQETEGEQLFCEAYTGA